MLVTLLGIVITQKEKCEQLLRLRIPGIVKHPMYLRNNAHTLGRESSPCSCTFNEILPISENKNQDERFNVYVCNYSSQLIIHSGFKSLTILTSEGLTPDRYSRRGRNGNWRGIPFLLQG